MLQRIHVLCTQSYVRCDPSDVLFRRFWRTRAQEPCSAWIALRNRSGCISNSFGLPGLVARRCVRDGRLTTWTEKFMCNPVLQNGTYPHCIRLAFLLHRNFDSSLKGRSIATAPVAAPDSTAIIHARCVSSSVKTYCLILMTSLHPNDLRSLYRSCDSLEAMSVC
jgi:hypothetical protein